ncbi:hypothetical protein [uncultured Ornithinimicrobium sp.]|jgi:hypothetical protein|uniref:hypothetical protein n=1 Tax=uncultured Ornithinimicrobium sp. TaxID=259307 RepID=UPI002597BF47|nr:hypothetical protein [uncultured Ornithinimicrobium sp.]
MKRSTTLRSPGSPGSVGARGALADRVRAWAAEPERGDVPGWVLITIMTAGLVAALWLVAEPLLTQLFTTAVTSVGT